ncbi:ZIP Zinc transporter [Trichuris trichiura]|uniref:ZIP Zinc transporter n=1 Tax=Trichuris trichiura TaxID=36087 RepID=A0A077YY65_TRITR|nr:ZIP Zinc transporter [Trichuris trichiura]
MQEYCEHLRLCSFCCLIATGVVVSAGIAPALFLPVKASRSAAHSGENLICTNPTSTWQSRSLNRLLSFAVGSLLGDVFLHQLPDMCNGARHESLLRSGLWILFGLLLCVVIEKCVQPDRHSQNLITALLNLVANVVDNFCHGLAVGASFLISIRFGTLTTFAILVHEIPHEIGDFALLLRADFSRRSAIIAQLLTALFGVIGALTALITQDMDALNERTTSWILPFCMGGFLNIALIQVLPELLKEMDMKESAWHIILILVGIGTIGCLGVIVEV